MKQTPSAQNLIDPRPTAIQRASASERPARAEAARRAEASPANPLPERGSVAGSKAAGWGPSRRPTRIVGFAAMLALASCAPAGVPAESSPDVASTAAASADAWTRVLDDFETVEGWSAHPSEGVELRIGQDSGFAGKAMRLDFDFRGGTGYAIARKAIPIDLPANYEFSFRIRADAPVNDLEFKLIDPSGDNVWWANRRRFEYPREWTRVRTQKRHIEFAWGPRGGGEMDSVAQIEIVVTAGTGGKGTVWIDDFTFRERDPDAPYTLTPAVRASSSIDGSDAARAIDGDSATLWRAGGAGEETIAIDFLRAREFGGFVIDWDSTRYATDYAVETSEDGARWETVYAVEFGNGGRDPIYLPESEARHLRLRLTRSAGGRGYAIREIDVKPVEWSLTPNAFFANLAREAPRGLYPRFLANEQTYWTVVGQSGDTRETLVDIDGRVETGLGGPALEPFLSMDGRLIGWNEVQPAQSLEKGYLPIPSVQWSAGPLRLTVTTFASGAREASTAYARYRIENTGAEEKDATLFLALRPFQVNPPWQFLNVLGGVARIREIGFEGEVVRVNGARAVVPVSAPSSFGAVPFDRGDIVEYLREQSFPDDDAVRDPRGFASAALVYPMTLRPGASYDVYVAIPLHESSPVARDEAAAERLLAESVRAWQGELDRFVIRIPTEMGRRISNTIRSQLAYILINRDGPSIQPGSRAYDRSWIRDGSLTSAALLRLGHAAEVREFAKWYAPHQRPNGYVPCCVSLRGADPVPEHDSHGQLIYLIAEYHRQTGDAAFLREMWPHVERAVAFIDTLRHQRMTPEYRTPEKRAFFGLVPESISHEGYSAKPMHSYWDDAFVLTGLNDAVYVAAQLGRDADRARFAAIRDEFRRHLLESIAAAMTMHRINYLPGSVELGDFDATSTTVSVNPMGGLGLLPQKPLELTFQRYYRESVRARLDGAQWDGYTPYEWRTVGTFVRLGWKREAHDAIGLFFGHQRPAAWNHWAEVVFRDPQSPRFIGDMPHTWVGSDFIRSILDLFAYEEPSDSSLVVGAGIPAAWMAADSAVSVEQLRTHYGPLDVEFKADASNPRVIRVRIGGGVRVPPGGIRIRTPLDGAIRSATVNGRSARVTNSNEITVRRLPADVVLRH